MITLAASLALALTVAIGMLPVFYVRGVNRGRKLEATSQITDLVTRRALGGDRFEPASLVHMECGGGEWSKWAPVKVVQREPVTTRAGQVLRTVEIDGQTRACDQCGFAEVRKLTVSK